MAVFWRSVQYGGPQYYCSDLTIFCNVFALVRISWTSCLCFVCVHLKTTLYRFSTYDRVLASLRVPTVIVDVVVCFSGFPERRAVWFLHGSLQHAVGTHQVSGGTRETTVRGLVYHVKQWSEWAHVEQLSEVWSTVWNSGDTPSQWTGSRLSCFPCFSQSSSYNRSRLVCSSCTFHDNSSR